MVARFERLAAHPNQGTTVMSEIDIEAVRAWLTGTANHISSGQSSIALSALDQLAKENERLKGVNPLLLRQYDEVLADIATRDREIDTLRTTLAAMQEAIAAAFQRAEALRKADRPSYPAVLDAIEPLRPHLPTPEPVPVDALVEAVRGIFAVLVPITPPPKSGELPADAMTRAFLEAAEKHGIEVRKIGEGAA